MAAGDDAQSVAVHQNMTSTDAGYNNVLTDSESVSALSVAPDCALSIQSIEWVSYQEIDEWRGNIEASYKGIVRAEQSCTALKANLRIKNSTSETQFNNTDVTLVPNGDGMTYTWTGTLEAPNEKEDYVGKLVLSVTDNNAD